MGWLPPSRVLRGIIDRSPASVSGEANGSLHLLADSSPRHFSGAQPFSTPSLPDLCAILFVKLQGHHPVVDAVRQLSLGPPLTSSSFWGYWSPDGYFHFSHSRSSLCTVSPHTPVTRTGGDDLTGAASLHAVKRLQFIPPLFPPSMMRSPCGPWFANFLYLIEWFSVLWRYFNSLDDISFSLREVWKSLGLIPSMLLLLLFLGPLTPFGV